ncbi:hypothetical protein L7F22_040711 [Adiantum nelumboides]|nr:hypothetical protein [Adiantum nelumboides]
MAKKDSSSKKRHEVIDGVTSDFVHQWYVDVYDIEGNRAENFLLFTSKNESSKFEQVGAIEDIMDGCAGKEGVPCNVIKIKGTNVSYKLDPLSFDSSHVREDEEYSLKKMGWVLCEEIKGTEDIVIAYKAVKNSEALLSSKNDERVKKRQRTQAPQPKSMVEDISQEESPTPSNLATRPSTLEENSLSKALVVSDPNMLREDAPSFDNIEPTNAQSTISLEVKGVEMTFDFPGVCEKKGKNEELGFHMFEKFFPFGPTTQFAIPVVKCDEAPPLYTYRTLAWDYVETLTNLFVNNPMAPATAAYLMPFVKENGKARPMQCEEVDRHKLETYDYWIISGLHSIHAAKIYIQSTTPRCLATKHLYATRNARILVDCQAEMCIELSRMTNKESHNVMKNAPYLEQLKQLRDQWRAFGSPSKPQQGLSKTSLQRIPWKRFSDYIGDKWASRDYHMIVSSKDIFDGWVTIMKKYAKGELLSQAQSSRKKGRQPSPATFRCLMGLKDGEVATLQQEINEGSILFLKNKWDSEDFIDMETRAKQIKQDRVLKEELVSLFNASIANTNGALKTWEELVIDFDITEDAYSKILGVCSDWVQKKLTRGADAGPLPNGAKDIVTFFLRKKENPHESSSTLPWRVYVVGCNLEALELIHNVYKDPITIGVVVLDAAHGVEGMKWDSFKFGRLVSSLLKMTCDPKQFVLLSFLTRRQMATFEDALEGMKCKYTMLVGSVDFLPASNHFALGAIDTFVVLTLINMEKHFINLDRYVNNVNKPCILDNTIVDEGEKGKGLEEDQQLARAILKKKKHVINTTINAFNDEHEVVLDVFACGHASKVALLNHKKTIGVVCNTQEQRDVEAICWRAHARTKPNGDPQENHVEPQILEIPPQGVEESSQDLASIIMKERMKTTSDPHQLEIGTTLTSATSQLQLCVILDLNGLLLQRCFARSQKFQSFHVGQHWVVLRPGCMEFLDALFARFRVGIWSTSLLKNVTAMIRCLETNAKKKYPFFMIWGQEQCHRHATKTIYRPDKMGVEAVFKPLKYVWSQFGDLCENTRTILIDDSPYKACTNPIENCIFPKSYDVNHPDSILIEEVLPYLLRLDQSNDSCGLIKFDRYGQEPVQHGHDLYEQFKVVIDEWNKPNKDDVSSSCSVQFGSLNDKKREKYFQTSIASCFKSLAIIGSKLSHVSTTKPPSFPPLKSTQIAKLQCLPLPSTMKDMEAMYIAQELGYDKHYINGRSARCFIQDLQKLYLHTK